MTRRTLCLLLTLGLLIAAPTGCAAKKKAPEPDVLRTSGFFDSYEGLKPNKNGNHAYIDESVSLRDYDAFIIEPVAVHFHKDVDPASVPKDVQDKTAKYMQSAITNAVGEYYAVVDKPGPGVARWRTALTSLRPSGQTNGGAAAEIELTDSVSGKRIILVVADDNAEDDPKLNPHSWHDSRAVIDVWAARIREYFDKVHGVEPQLIPKG